MNDQGNQLRDTNIAIAGLLALLVSALEKKKSIDVQDFAADLKLSLAEMPQDVLSSSIGQIFEMLIDHLSPSSSPRPHRPNWLKGVIPGGGGGA